MRTETPDSRPVGRRSGRTRTGLIALLTALAVLIITGCTTEEPEPPAPTPTGTATPKKRLFTVMTTDRIQTSDPAAVADTGSTMLTQNVFQRLMTADPTTQKLSPEPDAAQDCIVESRVVYSCTLRDDLKFSNGDPVTSKDVKFSIERAIRLNVPGSSASLLSSLRRIETPDRLTVRFVLSRYDTQFAWALATPAASIVDSEVYSPDEIQTKDEPIVGSGPFKVNKLTSDTLELGKYLSYVGYAPAQVGNAVIRTMPDSASIEEAMGKGEVDVVWRGLSTAAQQRIQSQISTSSDQLSTAGFRQTALEGARVQQVIWNPASKHRDSEAVRDAIAGALQEDRTLDSVVPVGVPGHRASFPLGGKADIDISWNTRIRLTLGYDSTAPNSLDLATQIRTRLEETGGMSVLLKPDNPDADLQLVDRKAWTRTGYAWLEPVIANPTAEDTSEIEKAERRVQTTPNVSPQQNAALAQLQNIAVDEAVVLPISQTNEYVYTARKASVEENAFGPGWQLGLWGMRIEK